METTSNGLKIYIHPHLVGLFVSYMIGVPSLKAEVIGLTQDRSQYLLRQEYDTFNDRGEWVHVIKEFQRDKWFIDSYHEDQFEEWMEMAARATVSGHSSN
jgi:hypothetical protein